MNTVSHVLGNQEKRKTRMGDEGEIRMEDIEGDIFEGRYYQQRQDHERREWGTSHALPVRSRTSVALGTHSYSYP